MKRVLFTLALLISVGTMDLSAQSVFKKLTKSLEKEVTNRVSKEVDKYVNKLTGGQQQGQGEVQPQSQPQSQTPQSQASGALSQAQLNSRKVQQATTIDAVIQYGLITGVTDGHEWVDMGLPSGTRWATCNVDATKPEQPGKLYAWGEIATKTAYSVENCKYYKKEIADFSGDKVSDVATAKWGEAWRMPTEKEFAELLHYCNWEYVQRGGRWGTKITSPKTNNSIFFPATGYKEGTSHQNVSGNGLYWTSSPHVDQWNSGAYMYQFGGALGEVSISDRSYGHAIRPVSDYNVNTEIPSSGEINGHKWVDLGLPSGLKWATCNIGASATDQGGDHYAWGEVLTFADKQSNKNEMYGKESGEIAGNSNYDAARALWGETWRLPTENEFIELVENCTFEWTSLGRSVGLKVTSKINGNYIFLPASGDYQTRGDLYGQPNDINKVAGYWTATPASNGYSYDACAFRMFDTKYYMQITNRFYGYSIRPVSE